MASVPLVPRSSHRLLALCGSLRAASSNLALLRAAALLTPPGVTIEFYGGLAALPAFNPDVEEACPAALPAAVVDLRAQVAAADGLLICCPEYARGVPGAFKNLLDWLVGGPEMTGKPIVLLNASARATEAQRSLALILATMSARVLPGGKATVLPDWGLDHSPQVMAADPTLAVPLRAAFDALMQGVGDD